MKPKKKPTTATIKWGRDTSRAMQSKELLCRHLPKLLSEMPNVAEFMLSFLTPMEIIEMYTHHRIITIGDRNAK